LEKITHRFGPLAVKTAHRETDFAHCLNDLIDQLAQDKPRQVEHRGGAHAGANVRGARGQVSQPRIESEIQFAFERAVDLVHQLKRLFQLETRANRLHPQMIFFVDHNAKSLPPIHHHRAARALSGMLAADQVALHQHLPVQRRKLLQAFGERFLHFGKRFHVRPNQFENRTAVRFLGPARKRTVAQIAREPHPAADYNFVMWPFTTQPLARSGKHVRKLHGKLERSLSSCLI